MSESDITIVGLQALGGASQIVLSWAADDPHQNGLPYLRFDHAEVRYSLAADMSDVVSLGDAFTAFADLPVPRGEKRYYQVRAIDKSSQSGAWSAAVAATEISGDVLLETNGFWRLPNGLILEWGSDTTDIGGSIQPQLKRIEVPFVFGGFAADSFFDSDVAIVCRKRGLIGTSPPSLWLELLAWNGSAVAAATGGHLVDWVAIGR